MKQQKCPDGRIVAAGTQRLFSDDGAIKDEEIGFFERHEQTLLGHTHVHWLYRGLASLDLVNNTGQVINSSRKEGYCVIDSFKFRELPDSPSRPEYFSIGHVKIRM